jgi:hypothetical protein
MRARTTLTIAAGAVLLLACTSASAGAASSLRAASSAGQPAGTCTTWQTVTTPTPPGFTAPPSEDSTALVTSVSVLSDKDVWFSGGDFTPPVSWGPWVLRWNGRSVTSPSQVSLVPSAGSDFSSQEPGSFDSETDGWVLMADQNEGQFDPDIATAEHWSDGHWTETPMAVSPDPAYKGVRSYSVAAVPLTTHGRLAPFTRPRSCSAPIRSAR